MAIRAQATSQRSSEHVTGEPVAAATKVRNVAVIADGHRRWARANGMSLSVCYSRGVDVAWARARDAIDLGIEEITLFCFSIENWRRPQEQTDELMSLIRRRILADTHSLSADGVRIRFIGERASLSRELREAMSWSEELTASNSDLMLYLAFNYSGRQEIEAAAARLGGREEESISEHLYAPEMHDPDLLIRTGGDKRLSNFMLWQLAYTELVFRDEYWPDFDRACFEECLAEFAGRRRRFGGD
ncbi:MAG TPA: polyprenyl diphosphate synthase [Solirubrobacteraceae bacterium]|nr:polyprenyl diphosphate synthase [Solirubrobacteraceae bacterium]